MNKPANVIDDGRLVLPANLRRCVIPTLKPGGTAVDQICGLPCDGFICDACWRRVTGPTRRAFVAEQKHLRSLKTPRPSPLMKELIKRVITESATRR